MKCGPIMMLWSEQGFTLQEILIAMFISSLLIGLCLTLFLFAEKAHRIWEQGNELTMDVDRTVQVVGYDFQSSRAVELFSDTSLVLRKRDGTSIRYLFNGDQVVRNRVPLFPDGEGKCIMRISMERLRHGSLYHVTAIGQLGTHKCEARCDAACPVSSVSVFRATE